MQKTVKDYIRTIVDFPHDGILFRDVTTLFADPRGFRICVDQLLAPYAGMRIDKGSRCSVTLPADFARASSVGSGS